MPRTQETIRTLYTFSWIFVYTLYTFLHNFVYMLYTFLHNFVYNTCNHTTIHDWFDRRIPWHI
jgi:hypothetical protein